jgi:hypothetical protein
MRSWDCPSPRGSTGGERLAAARDVAIIVLCAVIVAFALLAFVGAAREAPARAAQPAAARVAV